jgi:hypothetical protein
MGNDKNVTYTIISILGRVPLIVLRSKMTVGMMRICRQSVFLAMTPKGKKIN